MSHFGSGVQALEFLGLDASADRAAVRRAYASLLKQIDQVAQADQFERLRAAYEYALKELAAREAGEPGGAADGVGYGSASAASQQAQRPACDAVQVIAQELLAPEVIAAQVFERFMSCFASCQSLPAPRRASALLEHLRQALQESDMASLDVAALFELRVLQQVFGVWQRANLDLLIAGNACFAWGRDVARMPGAQYGHARLGATATDIVAQYRSCMTRYPDRWLRFRADLEGNPRAAQRVSEDQLADLAEILRAFPALVQLAIGADTVAVLRERIGQASSSYPARARAMLRQVMRSGGAWMVRHFKTMSFVGLSMLLLITWIAIAPHGVPSKPGTQATEASIQPGRRVAGVTPRSEAGYWATDVYTSYRGLTYRRYCRSLTIDDTECVYLDVLTGENLDEVYARENRGGSAAAAGNQGGLPP